MDPLDMMIADGWEAVLEKLFCPLDKLSLVHCNSQLEQTFEAKISLWKSAAIIKIMINHNIKGEEDLFELPNNCVLSCRLVNKSWRCAVDDVLNYYPGHIDCTFRTSAKVEKFLRDFPPSGTTRPPIINQRVWISCEPSYYTQHGPGGRYSPTVEQIVELLSRVGHVLKDASLVMRDLQSYQESGAIISQLLQNVPKAKFIRMSFDLANTQLQLRRVPQQIIEKYPELNIPKLPMLENFCIHCNSNLYGRPINIPASLPCPDLSHIFSNLKSLSLPLSLWKDEYNRSGLFPNLGHLYLKGIGLDEEVVEEKIFKLFWSLDAPHLTYTSLNFGKDCEKSNKVAYFCQKVMYFSLGDKWVSNLHKGRDWSIVLSLDSH